MKPCSPELLTLLKSGQFYASDLYQLNLVGGGVLYYSAGDQSITANGITYPATGTYGTGTIGGPYFDRKDNKAKIHQKIGVEVDSLVFDVIPGSATIFGAPWLQACQDGQFDGATCLLDRAFMPVYGNTAAGTVNIFTGVVAEVDVGRSLSTFSVNSKLELLNEKFPHNLYQAGCVNNLGDAACGVSLASYSALGSCIAGCTQTAIMFAPPGGDGSVFNLGKITMTSGICNGLSRSILSCDLDLGQASLLGPFPSAPSFGDSFVMYYGCDKSMGANGCLKFSNLARFRGMPFTPQPSQAI